MKYLLRALGVVLLETGFYYYLSGIRVPHPFYALLVINLLVLGVILISVSF